MHLQIKNIPAFLILILNTITLEPFSIGDIPIRPIQVWHLKMPVLDFALGNLHMLLMPTVLMRRKKKRSGAAKSLWSMF